MPMKVLPDGMHHCFSPQSLGPVLLARCRRTLSLFFSSRAACQVTAAALKHRTSLFTISDNLSRMSSRFCSNLQQL
eukprot:584549-Hanusia_phi.AAC.4